MYYVYGLGAKWRSYLGAFACPQDALVNIDGWRESNERYAACAGQVNQPGKRPWVIRSFEDGQAFLRAATGADAPTPTAVPACRVVTPSIKQPIKDKESKMNNKNLGLNLDGKVWRVTPQFREWNSTLSRPHDVEEGATHLVLGYIEKGDMVAVMRYGTDYKDGFIIPGRFVRSALRELGVEVADEPATRKPIVEEDEDGRLNFNFDTTGMNMTVFYLDGKEPDIYGDGS